MVAFNTICTIWTNHYLCYNSDFRYTVHSIWGSLQEKGHYRNYLLVLCSRLWLHRHNASFPSWRATMATQVQILYSAFGQCIYHRMRNTRDTHPRYCSVQRVSLKIHSTVIHVVTVHYQITWLYYKSACRWTGRLVFNFWSAPSRILKIISYCSQAKHSSMTSIWFFQIWWPSYQVGSTQETLGDCEKLVLHLRDQAGSLRRKQS